MCVCQAYLSSWNLPLIMINNDDEVIFLTAAKERRGELSGKKKTCVFMSVIYSTDIVFETVF